MSLWNVKNLPNPPIVTCKGFINSKELENLENILNEGIKHFKEEQFMFAESVLLARIIYRSKTKFRTAKDFQSLIKVNHALKNYFAVNISTNLCNFIDLLPKKIFNKETYLPTKNMLDYILVRLQGLSKLMERIFNTSEKAALELKYRINTGNFWKIAILAYAIVSRLLVLAKHTAKYLCELYDNLFNFREYFKNTTSSWLPPDYVLPTNLKDWLNVEWIDAEYIPEAPKEKLRIIDFFDLVGVDDDDDVQFCDEYVLVDEDQDVEFIQEFKNIMNKKINKEFTQPQVNKNSLRGFHVDDDIGEIIIDTEENIPTETKTINLEKNNIPSKNKLNKVDDSVVLINDDSSIDLNIPKAKVKNKKNKKRKLELETTVSNKNKKIKLGNESAKISKKKRKKNLLNKSERSFTHQDNTVICINDTDSFLSKAALKIKKKNSLGKKIFSPVNKKNVSVNDSRVFNQNKSMKTKRKQKNKKKRISDKSRQ